MSGGISQTRELVKKAYPDSKGWHAKVDKMSDAQVIAIHLRLKNRRGKAA